MLGLRLAVDRLAYSAYWLTPPGLPKRFDTRFFMAMLPSGQTALHDGVEAVEHRWLRPAEAIDPASNFTLVNATRRILQSIAHFQNAQTCFDFAQQRNIPLVMPRLASGPKGQRPVMPEEAPYAEISRIDPDGAGHGRYALEPGHAVKLSDRVWRVTANNGSVDRAGHQYVLRGRSGQHLGRDRPGSRRSRPLRRRHGRRARPRQMDLRHAHAYGPLAGRRATAGRHGAPVIGLVTAATDRQDATFAPDHMPRHGDRIALGPQTTLRVVHTQAMHRTISAICSRKRRRCSRATT
jgi:hypothetical protein